MSEGQGERLGAGRPLWLPLGPLMASQRPLCGHSWRNREDMGRVPAEADPGAKAELYANLGIEITYSPDQRVVSVAARPDHVPRSGVTQSLSIFDAEVIVPSGLGGGDLQLVRSR